MIVDLIDTIEALEPLADNWDAVYSADRHARYFLSFRFMRQWLPAFNGHWFVLAAKPTEKSLYEAFLPLRLRTHMRDDGHCASELLMAGNYGADYTGIIALPDRARSAMPALGRALKLLHWSQISFDYVAADDNRYRQLLAHLSDPRLAMRTELRVNQRDNVDNLVCPVVHLPPLWDDYLGGLSANMRQKLRRLLRLYETDPAIEVTHPTSRSIREDVEQMNRLWLGKWQDRKGNERARKIIASNTKMLLDAYVRGDLYMPMLRRDGVMVAALATLVDPIKKAAHFYMTGRDEAFEGPSPGLFLHAHSIRELIGHGFGSYDFLRGDEPYKMLFGTTQRHLQCIRIATRSGRNLGDGLEPRAVPTALALATMAHRSGRFRQAAVAYGQVLSTNPDNIDALYRYGQLLGQIGKAEDARKLLGRARALRSRSLRSTHREHAS